MATAIRIKLADFLEVLSKPLPENEQPVRRDFTQLKLAESWLTQSHPECRRRGRPEGRSDSISCSSTGPGTQKIDEGDLRAIQKYLKNNTASRRDLEFHLNMTSRAVLRRLDLLKERGIVKHLPGHVYGLSEDIEEAVL